MQRLTPALLTLMLLVPGTALASILYWQHSDVTFRASDTDYLSHHPNLKGLVIGGLDRKITVLVTGDNYNQEFDLGVVSLRDSIELPDEEPFFGKELVLGSLPEGNYTLNVAQYTTSGELTDRTFQQLTVDTTPPHIGRMFWNSANYKLDNIPQNQWLGDFEVWNHGLGDLYDTGSGILQVELYATNQGQSEPVGQILQLSYNPNEREARRGGSPNAVFAGAEKPYTLVARVTDRAGNVSHLSRNITWTEIGLEPELVAVNDGSFNGNFIPGSPFSGFQAYTPGMTVHSYYFKLVYRLPEWWANPANPGRMFSTRNHFNSYEYVKDGYAYFQLSTVYSKGDPRVHERPIGRHDRWVSYFLYHDLNLADHLAAPPANARQQVWIEGQGWTTIGHIMLGAHNQHNVPKRFRVTADPRPYIQRVHLQQHGPANVVSNCVIQPNQTSCEGDLPSSEQYVDWQGASPGIPAGVIHIRHFWMNKLLREDNHDLKSGNMGGVNVTIDRSLPIMTTAEKILYSNLVHIYAFKELAGEDWNRVQMSRIGVRLTDENDESYESWVEGADGHFGLNNQNVPLGGAFMEDRILLPDVPAGTYQLHAIAKDTADNTVTHGLGWFDVEWDSPEVNWQDEDGNTLEQGTIRKLDQVRLSVIDDNNYTIDNVYLTGGPSNDSFELKVVSVGADLYAIESPSVFPTLVEGEFYSLTATVIDMLGNQTIETSRFKYIPENVVRIGSLIALPVDTILYDHDDSPITKVIIEPLTLEGGQLASGEHDYFVTLRTDAEFPIFIDGIQVFPGQTRLFMVDLGDGNKATEIPIGVKSGDQVAKSDIMIEIPQLRSKWD